MAEMTKEVIVASCKANGGYAAPHLNDQLFLHCKGFTAIQNLEPYKDVKVLWLEQNALSELRGLEGQSEALVSLFLQNNFIRSLVSLTARLNGLRVLNVSHNYLTSLHGLATACPSLETLQASHNQLTSLEACEELWQLAGSLTSVDLSFNRIETSRAPLESAAASPAPSSPLTIAAAANTADDDEVRVIDPTNEAAVGQAPVPAAKPGPTAVPAAATTISEDALALVHFFQHLPLVSVVYMQGNGLSRRLRSYRRNMILHLPALTYLDERPVFPEERRVVEAWGRGGEDMEAAERAAIREEKRAHLTQCVRLLTEQREGQREVRDRLTRQLEQRRAQELEELTQRRRRDRDSRAALEAAEDAAREVAEKAEQDARWDLEDAFRAAHASLAGSEAAHRHAYEQHVAVTSTAQAVAAAQGSSEVNEAAAVKVLEDAGAATAYTNFFLRRPDAPEQPVATATSTALAELLQSDDDILKGMELEIEHVLYDLNSAAGKGPATTSPATTTTTTAAPPAPAVTRHADPFFLEQGGSLGDELPSSYTSRQATDRATLRMGRNVHAAVDHVSQQLKAQQRRRSSGSQREDVWQRFEQWEARRTSLPTNQ